jgi:hypothetical protein
MVSMLENDPDDPALVLWVEIHMAYKNWYFFDILLRSDGATFKPYSNIHEQNCVAALKEPKMWQQKNTATLLA